MNGRGKERYMDTNKTPPAGLAGNRKARLTAMERLVIETWLDAGRTPYAIAQELGRPPKTVMREIRGRAVESGKGAGLAMMTGLFFITVTDNGTEFTLPDKIEKDCEGNKVANLFYANACASCQEPHVERNHEFIRLVLPKGSHYFLPTSFDLPTTFSTQSNKEVTKTQRHTGIVIFICVFVTSL